MMNYHFWNLSMGNEDKHEKESQCTYDVTLRFTHITTVAVEKQYYIF
jgi:hypothetical protein